MAYSILSCKTIITSDATTALLRKKNYECSRKIEKNKKYRKAYSFVLVSDAEVLLLLKSANEDQEEVLAVEELVEAVNALIETSQLVRLVLEIQQSECSVTQTTGHTHMRICTAQQTSMVLCNTGWSAVLGNNTRNVYVL